MEDAPPPPNVLVIKLQDNLLKIPNVSPVLPPDKHGGHVTYRDYAGVGKMVQIVSHPPHPVGWRWTPPLIHIIQYVMIYYHVRYLIGLLPIRNHPTRIRDYVMLYYPIMPIMPRRHLGWEMPSCVHRNWHHFWGIHYMRVMNIRHLESI
jgi:hypothetical protein